MVKDVLIVDDHMVTRTGLKSLLQDFRSGLQIHEATDGDSFLKIMKSRKIDLAIMDLQLPNTDTIGLIEFVSIRYPDTYSLVFSMLPENIYGQRVLQAGACGYLSKDAPMDEIQRAMELAFLHKKYLSQFLISHLSKGGNEKREANPFEKLSHREFEIINLLVAGRSITEIARQLQIKPSTVGTYKNRIFQKVKVSTVFELKEIGALYGLVPQI